MAVWSATSSSDANITVVNGSDWLSTLTGVPEGARMVIVTPGEARSLLAANTHNRRLQPVRVNQLAGAMTRGEWRFNGDAIRVGVENGKLVLLDGQHRLAACVKSNRPFRSLVAKVAVDVQHTMDQGAKRTIGDVLYMRGERGYTTLGAVARGVWYWEQRGGIPIGGNRLVPTIGQLLDVLARHPGLREYARTDADHGGSRIAMHHYLASLIDQVAADKFFEGLRTGENLSANNPVLVLRNRLIAMKAMPAYKEKPLAIAAFISRAFHAYVNGEEIQRLVYDPRNRFPSLIPSDAVLAAHGIDPDQFHKRGEVQ